jgi:hypothetical protein
MGIRGCTKAGRNVSFAGAEVLAAAGANQKPLLLSYLPFTSSGCRRTNAAAHRLFAGDAAALFGQNYLASLLSGWPSRASVLVGRAAGGVSGRTGVSCGRENASLPVAASRAGLLAFPPFLPLYARRARRRAASAFFCVALAQHEAGLSTKSMYRVPADIWVAWHGSIPGCSKYHENLAAQDWHMKWR